MDSKLDTKAPERTEKKRKIAEIPSVFRPMFWSDADSRCSVVKEIKKRCELLKRDAAADSMQKQVLCERAVFLAVTLESAERKAIEGGRFDAGVYLALVNCLVGTLRLLGIERKAKIARLADYVKQSEQKTERPKNERA